MALKDMLKYMHIDTQCTYAILQNGPKTAIIFNPW